MSDDLISRQAAADVVNFECGEWRGLAKTIIDKLESLPSAEPKRGKWISADAIFGGIPFYCSECGENTRDTVMGEPRWNYCPMCGSYNGGENEI